MSEFDFRPNIPIFRLKGQRIKTDQVGSHCRAPQTGFYLVIAHGFPSMNVLYLPPAKMVARQWFSYTRMQRFIWRVRDKTRRLKTLLGW
jgi:hypothetical protein